jgi:hypothetical protein
MFRINYHIGTTGTEMFCPPSAWRLLLIREVLAGIPEPAESSTVASAFFELREES